MHRARGAGYAALTGCSSGDDDLQTFIAETNKEAGGRVEPLPEVKPYETYAYAATDMRSPFMPSPGRRQHQRLRPDAHRNREFLEQYSLDTMKMVGSMRLGGQHVRAGADQGWPGASVVIGQLHRPERRQDHRHHPVKDQSVKSFRTAWAATSSAPPRLR